MEGGESLLDTLFDEENADNGQDIEMFDVEEGEVICESSKTEVGDSCNGGADHANEKSGIRNSKRKKKKSKNKRKKGSGDASVDDTTRFVLDACKRLREPKSYLMWTAVGCLGVSALRDLLKEVDAIQLCGGQKTADGRRYRNGGGILWNIIKLRDPNAYREIMRKGKYFEKQFRKEANAKQELRSRSEASIQNITLDACIGMSYPSDCLKMASKESVELEISTAREKRVSVHDRIRVPVTYDDLLRADDTKDELA